MLGRPSVGRGLGDGAIVRRCVWGNARLLIRQSGGTIFTPAEGLAFFHLVADRGAFFPLLVWLSVAPAHSPDDAKMESSRGSRQLWSAGKAHVCGLAEGREPGWAPQDSLPASRQLLPILQEVWPPAVSRGCREAEEPLHHHAERGPPAREGQRPPLQHPHHRAVSGRRARGVPASHSRVNPCLGQGCRQHSRPWRPLLGRSHPFGV